MNNLFNPTDFSQILVRIENLKPDSQREWGKMNVAQMLAHCNIAMETATGDKVLKRIFAGRIIGSLIKKKVLDEKPFRKNSPTDKSFIFPDTMQFEEEKIKLIGSIKKFHEGGPEKCTKHPHPFFGYYSPAQWSILQWKHLDHHLRQFGV
jgi:hypothetical protein